MRTSLRADLGNTTSVPFLQARRPLHYLEYFKKGVGIGAYGIEREVLASEGKLARR